MLKNIIVFLLICLTGSGFASAQVADKADQVHPVLIGTEIPAAALKDPEGQTVQLKNVLKDKHTVLVFYRGGWCPYCNAHLAGLAQSESQLRSLGYQIVAISPDSPESLQASKQEKNLGYQLFSDTKSLLAQQLGIAFKAPVLYGTVLPKASNKENPGVLPAPAIFFVNGKGEIEFSYVNPDYKVRASPELLIAVAKALKN